MTAWRSSSRWRSPPTSPTWRTITIFAFSVSDRIDGHVAWYGTDHRPGDVSWSISECVMIKAIVIPADVEQPLRQEQLSPADAAAYREIVGGPLEIVTFDRPRACLYVNEEGKLETAAVVNARATLLSWAHNSALRNRNDVVVGDVLLVGPPDGQGVDLGIPETYVELLFATTAFTIEVQVHGDDGWYGNEQVYSDVFAAYSAGVTLALRWTNVVDVRVVPAKVG